MSSYSDLVEAFKYRGLFEAVEAHAAKMYVAMSTSKMLTKQEKMMAGNNTEPLFMVYEADNGYYASVGTHGIVVGATLSEVCEAAQRLVATVKLKKDDEDKTLEALAKSPVPPIEVFDWRKGTHSALAKSPKRKSIGAIAAAVFGPRP